MQTLTSEAARKAILAGQAPADLRVSGTLDLSGTNVEDLPAGLTCRKLDVHGCPKLRALPERLQCPNVNAANCDSLAHVPPGLSLYTMNLAGSAVEQLPDDLNVEFQLDLTGCVALRELPASLKVGSLVVSNCVRLTTLPAGLDVCFLDAEGCVSLETVEPGAKLHIGRLNLRNCAKLRELPTGLGPLAHLDLAGCENIASLPADLRVTGWIDVADTALPSLPEHLGGLPLRWRGVIVDERIAFRPQTITGRDVLQEPNAERRRVMLERIGFERFYAEVDAKVLDEDRDPGGPRRLLKVAMKDDEDLVCVSVNCPSTDRHYLIRVPPKMKTCRQAIAWTAGFDDPDDYTPLVET